ncbi:MAG TPA: transketolase [Clostridiales bacterium]|nr:MAG: transketolase [Clostridiales bacterium GWD2_32_19]HCC07641.1 transketolase [Clostridiales bacterium]
MEIATREAYGIALAEIGAQNENIVVLDADISKATKTENFKKVCPDRFINMGIAEGDMMSTAAGLSTCGKIVFASTFAMFAAGRGYEQIRNSICYPNLNVKVAATHAGISVGEDGASHQCIEDIALMRVIPNMTVFSPCDATETKAIIKYCVENKGPMYIRLGRLKVQDVFNEESYKFKFGCGVEIADGGDIAIFATGMMTGVAIKANELLKAKGIKARIINIHTIKPIDKEIIIKAAKDIGKIVTLEEHNIYGGFGSAVCEVLSENYPTKVKMIGVSDQFGKSGKAEEVIKLYGLDAESVAKKIEEFVKN